MCAVTRAVLPDAALVRFVAAPDGSIVADLKARLPGRGVWVRAERKYVGEAVKRNVFRKALESPVVPPSDLADQVAARLREAALGRLGLARKAGSVLAGFAKVEVAIAKERLIVLLAASDAAEDGLRKLRQAVLRRFGDEPAVPVLALFTSEQLGLALGRSNVIHAAVLQGPAGESFMDAAIRLQRYEGVGGGEAEIGAAEPPGNDG
jgi:predicted RNA-binding protein YlxR (DUF448 family)